MRGRNLILAILALCFLGVGIGWGQAEAPATATTAATTTPTTTETTAPATAAPTPPVAPPPVTPISPPTATPTPPLVVKPTPPEAVPVELPLRLFGLEFFELAPAAVAPVAETPVPPTYSLGPGDTLNIRFWTKTVEETAYTPVINPDGTIFLPLVGVVTIRGLTLDQARELLLREFSRYYQDVKLEVTLEKIRSVQVFVVGEAARPGGYTLSALSTAFNAIYMAGGPSPRGSMRKIELIRNAEKAGGLDLYRYLLSGDKSEDYALESGDTLFVPVVGDVVAIRGQVKRPALYELKGGERLKDLIEMAGGVQADAYFGQAQIERIKDNKEKMIVDVNLAAALESGETDQNLLLKDGDAVEVFRTLELKANYVELEGHVMRPGQYELKPGMRVSDLVNAAEGVSLEEIFWEQANLYRVLPDRTIQIIPFNLDKAMQGAQEEDLTLQPWDKIVIYTHQEAAWLDRTVTIEGSVKNSGTYKRWGGMRVRDLIFAAGGLLPETAQTAEIARAKGEHDSEVIDVDLGKVLFGSDDAANLILQDRDRVSIKAVGRFLRKAEAATISGEVKFPGVYAFENKKIKLSELVEKAGGLGEDAFPEGAVLLRRRDKLLTKEQRETAQAVQSTLQSVVERLYQLELAKAGASAQQGAQQPAPSVSTITSVPTQPTELQAAALAGTALESTAAEAGAETMPLAPAQRLPSILPSGKIAINLKEILETKGAVGDILLEDGDVVRVPKRPLTVVVSGAVANPGAIIYEPGKNVEYYVQRVGGYNWDGDSSHSVLVRANGEVVLANKAQIVGRGDIIFTPTKVVVEVPKTHSEKIRESISLATNVATVLYVIHILAKG